MIYANKPLYAKVYDFDPSQELLDGEDDQGKYIIRQVDIFAIDGFRGGLREICLITGFRSQSYQLLPQE